MSKTPPSSIRATLDEVLGLVDDAGRAPKNSKRSGKWRAVEQRHLKKHPGCAICGKTKQVNVHHVLPFELFPQMELRPDNLITLCPAHHLIFGHLGDWSLFNCLVKADAEIWRFRYKAARAMMKLAKQEAARPQSKRSSHVH